LGSNLKKKTELLRRRANKDNPSFLSRWLDISAGPCSANCRGLVSQLLQTAQTAFPRPLTLEAQFGESCVNPQSLPATSAFFGSNCPKLVKPSSMSEFVWQRELKNSFPIGSFYAVRSLDDLELLQL
jgi:hypothetical protein